jgi:hypothetical protein
MAVMAVLVFGLEEIAALAAVLFFHFNQSSPSHIVGSRYGSQSFVQHPQRMCILPWYLPCLQIWMFKVMGSPA